MFASSLAVAAASAADLGSSCSAGDRGLRAARFQRVGGSCVVGCRESDCFARGHRGLLRIDVSAQQSLVVCLALIIPRVEIVHLSLLGLRCELRRLQGRRPERLPTPPRTCLELESDSSKQQEMCLPWQFWRWPRQTHDVSAGLRLPTLRSQVTQIVKSGSHQNASKVLCCESRHTCLERPHKSAIKGLSDCGEIGRHMHELHVRPLLLHRRSVLITDVS